MIKKSLIIFGILSIVLIVFFSVKGIKKDSESMLKVESVPLYDSTGWSYDILVDHKIFIHQEYIPAIMGKKKFVTKEDAQKTAGLVIKKLISKKRPVVTREDLTALKISF